MTATCPSGKQVVGTGGEIIGGNGQAALDDVRPNAELTSVFVHGLEDENGTTASWSVTAYAVCAAPVSGLERVAAETAESSADKVATATCPGGKLALGGGGELSLGAGRIMRTLTASADLESVSASGREDQDGTSSTWVVRAFAICALTTYRLTATTPLDSTADKTARARCFDYNRNLGGGGQISGAVGQTSLQQFWPGNAQAHEDATGTASSWSLAAYAICAVLPPGYHRVSGTSDLSEVTGRAGERRLPERHARGGRGRGHR